MSQEDELDIVEPAEWDVVLSNLELNADLDLLVLTSNATQVRFVDEIRLGPSWRSVTPIRVKEPDLPVVSALTRGSSQTQKP